MLANDLYFVCYNDYTGKPRVHSRAFAIGLAAGLLTELIISGRMTSDGEKLRITSLNPPSDALAHLILDQLIVEKNHQHTIRTWLQYLSAQSTGQVARRLEVAGLLRSHTDGWVKKQTIFLPTDPNTAGAPGATLLARLHQRSPLDPHRSMLTGLCAAIGLTRYLLDGTPPESSAYLQHVIDALPGPIRGFLYHTNAVVAGIALLSALVHRTSPTSILESCCEPHPASARKGKFGISADGHPTLGELQALAAWASGLLAGCCFGGGPS